MKSSGRHYLDKLTIKYPFATKKQEKTKKIGEKLKKRIKIA